MKNILSNIASDNEIIIEKMEVMFDHIQLLISFSPRKLAVNVIKALKGCSVFIFLKWHPEIRKAKFWCGHLWSSYYLESLGNMSKPVVEAHINNQKYNTHKK